MKFKYEFEKFNKKKMKYLYYGDTVSMDVIEPQRNVNPDTFKRVVIWERNSEIV